MSLVCGESRAEAFFALHVDAGSDGLEVFDCFQNSKALGKREYAFNLCGKKSAISL